ncbi:MAG: PDGLE domain-containing protein, partial [Thermoguttaceae bacterium]|nr:PDGLE domain-containing protein [Thermoguttaceae bacterium]
VTIMTLVSGVTELPFKVFAAAMIPIHLAIGLGEGLATMVVLEFVRKNLPDFQAAKLESPGFSFRNLCWVFALAALVIGGGISLLASGKPDGLEWSMEQVAQTSELDAPESQLHQISETITEKCSFLPDYEIPGTDGAWYGTVVSGIVGVLIMICGAMIFYRKKKPAQAE